MRVSTEDAYTMVRRLAREEGLLVGISGGAALAGALKIAKTARNAVIVTIFPDSADKYMSERFWNSPELKLSALSCQLSVGIQRALRMHLKTDS